MSAITHTYTFTGKGEDFGPRADGMVTLHTFEPTDPLKTTIRDAIAGAKWQDRDDILGSYNRIVCTDGVLSTVPDHRASGGINPGSADWAPRAWLYQYLDADEIANPNYFTLNLCAMGRRAYFDSNGWPPAIIDGFARSILDEERRIGRSVVVTNHADFQRNRSDAGSIAIDLVMKRYAQLKAERPVADIDTFLLETIRIDAGANIRAEPSDAGALLFKTSSTSSAVSVGTKAGFHAYWIEAQKRWGYTSTAANVLSRTPYTSGGFTQADIDAARLAGVKSGTAAGFADAKTKARVAVEGIK